MFDFFLRRRMFNPLRSVQSGATLSGLAMSTLAIWCRDVRSCDVRSRNFSIPTSNTYSKNCYVHYRHWSERRPYSTDRNLHALFLGTVNSETL